MLRVTSYGKQAKRIVHSSRDAPEIHFGENEDPSSVPGARVHKKPQRRPASPPRLDRVTQLATETPPSRVPLSPKPIPRNVSRKPMVHLASPARRKPPRITSFKPASPLVLVDISVEDGEGNKLSEETRKVAQGSGGIRVSRGDDPARSKHSTVRRKPLRIESSDEEDEMSVPSKPSPAKPIHLVAKASNGMHTKRLLEVMKPAVSSRQPLADAATPLSLDDEPVKPPARTEISPVATRSVKTRSVNTVASSSRQPLQDVPNPFSRHDVPAKPIARTESVPRNVSRRLSMRPAQPVQPPAVQLARVPLSRHDAPAKPFARTENIHTETVPRTVSRRLSMRPAQPIYRPTPKVELSVEPVRVQVASTPPPHAQPVACAVPRAGPIVPVLKVTLQTRPQFPVKEPVSPVQRRPTQRIHCPQVTPIKPSTKHADAPRRAARHSMAVTIAASPVRRAGKVIVVTLQSPLPIRRTRQSLLPTKNSHSPIALQRRKTVRKAAEAGLDIHSPVPVSRVRKPLKDFSEESMTPQVLVPDVEAIPTVARSARPLTPIRSQARYRASPPSPNGSDLDLSLEMSNLELQSMELDDQDISIPQKPSSFELLLKECGQNAPSDFSSLIHRFPSDAIITGDKPFRKIGEASYSEVFGVGDVVLKVIPLTGGGDLEGEECPPPSEPKDVLNEIIVTRAMGKVDDGFGQLLKTFVVRGQYPALLLKLWDDYYEEKGSESVKPHAFSASQPYAIIVLENGGPDLEAYTFATTKIAWKQACSLFFQVVRTLAVAEDRVEFEHRDLHWGQILVNDVEESNPVKGTKLFMDYSHGVKVTVIDLGLSRMNSAHGEVHWTPFDDDVFEGIGHYQFDIYRLMRDHIDEDWESYHPLTNVMWLHYLCVQLLDHKKLKAPRKSASKQGYTERDCYDTLIEMEQLLGSFSMNRPTRKGRKKTMAVSTVKLESAAGIMRYAATKGWVDWEDGSESDEDESMSARSRQ